MTNSMEKKQGKSKQESKKSLKGHQKMFFRQTEDEYEESKMSNPYERGIEHFTMKDGSLLKTKQENSVHHTSLIIPNQTKSVCQEEMKESSEQNYVYDQFQDDSINPFDPDYLLMTLQTVIENSYDQFVNLDCIMQPNILSDIGRLRFMLIHFVHETIKKAVDEDGNFDSIIFMSLMGDLSAMQHFLYLQYPYLHIDYEEEQEVELYELMTDQQWEAEFQLMFSQQNIHKTVSQLQRDIQQDYIRSLSKNDLIRLTRESMEGPLDSLVSSKEGLFQQIASFATNPTNNCKKPQQQFKVNIRKQNSTKNHQNTQQKPKQNQNVNHIQLFNIQPIQSNQSPQNSSSQHNSNKNLSYQEFVAMLQKQKNLQQIKQKQKQSKQKQKQKQKKQSQSNKKSQFDQILGIKNDQQSKNYLKPFIGNFKKNQTDQQLKQILGLTNDQTQTPKKEQNKLNQQETPEFKQNKSQSVQKCRSQQMERENLPNLSTISKTSQSITKNEPPLSNSRQINNTMNKPGHMNQFQNKLISSYQNIQSKRDESMQSKSPPSGMNMNSQFKNSAKIIQNAQNTSKQPIVGSQPPPVLGSLNQAPILGSINQTKLISPKPPVFQSIPQSISSNNQGIRQNNFMPPLNSLPNNNLNRNSRDQNPTFRSPQQQNSSSQMFSNIQTNQMNRNSNIQNKSNLLLRNQNFSPNNPQTIVNPTFAGHQPQFSQGFQQFKNSNSIPNQINNFSIASIPSNFNQTSASLPNFVQNLSSLPSNSYIEPQKIINQGLINLPVTQNGQSLSFHTQKMESQETSKTDSKKIQNIPKELKPSSSINCKQIIKKGTIYDNQVLQNMKLKDFIRIFSQQELQKMYSDIYSELLLMKKWKILNFGIDYSLSQKLRYLSNIRADQVKNTEVKNLKFLSRQNKCERKSTNRQFQEPIPLMMTLKKKIELINQQNFYQQQDKQKDLNLILGIKKSTHLETIKREFSNIENVQELLQQKISLLQDGILQNDGQIFSAEGYLSIHEELTTINKDLQTVGKWVIASEFCSQTVDQSLDSVKIAPIKKEKCLSNFDVLYQLYHNISMIDLSMQIMTKNLEELQK